MSVMMPLAGEQKKRVCYFFDSDIGNYHYGNGHPMKPHRIKMTHSLVMNYGLYKRMEIFRAKPATRKEMAQFHTDEYVDFLARITPDNMDNFGREQAKFNVGDDCPVFDGLFEYCSISAGGSMEGAARLSRDKCDIAVNWAGGLHHAKKSEASGFCYVNDIVLGVLELLRYHPRVLYIDIDVHHGDGVEEAFYTTDRVMTVSFHKYGEYFPGTGELRDIGVSKGKYYSCNVPLRDGITDEAYKNVFEPTISKVMEWYRPSAIVLQCGSDSLSGDRLGSFNLTMRGHANCVQFVKSFNLPTLLLGGGGYTIRNVSRAWAFETGLAAGVELGGEIPVNEYYEYFGPTYQLDVLPTNMEDLNTVEYLEKVKIQVFENLRHTGFAPSVQMTPIPKMDNDDMEMDEDAESQDTRKPRLLSQFYADECKLIRNLTSERLLDSLRTNDAEFEESDDEDDVERQRLGQASQKRPRLDEEETAPTSAGSYIDRVAASGMEDHLQLPQTTPVPSTKIASPLSPSTLAPSSPVLAHSNLPAFDDTIPIPEGDGDQLAVLLPVAATIDSSHYPVPIRSTSPDPVLNRHQNANIQAMRLA